jgi:prepilin-type N-terminal cleavage/methylation domain-containing protein
MHTRHTTHGFTLIEVLVASVVTGIALAAVSWTLLAAAQTQAVLSEDPTPYLLAREIRELADVLPREPSGVVGVTHASNLMALDSLHGARFSPPVRANRTTQASLSGWSQRVTVSVCTLDDLASTTGESPTTGVGRNAERLYRLSVGIVHDGRDVGRFEWWLTP